MSYTPTKGSPQPTVPGADPVEVALTKVQQFIASPTVPLDPGTKSMLTSIETDLLLAVTVADPNGMKASERSVLLNAAQAKIAAGDVAGGVADAVTFATDVPAHPTPWVRWARWICVQNGAADPLPGGP